MFEYRWSPKAQTLTEPWVDPNDRYLASLENFIYDMSKIDRISAAANPVPISYIKIVVRYKLRSFDPSISIILLYIPGI